MMMIAGENPMEGHPDTVIIGAQLFSKNCVQCHANEEKNMCDASTMVSMAVSHGDLCYASEKKGFCFTHRSFRVRGQ